jgi:hypothetical protein
MTRHTTSLLEFRPGRHFFATDAVCCLIILSFGPQQQTIRLSRLFENELILGRLLLHIAIRVSPQLSNLET